MNTFKVFRRLIVCHTTCLTPRATPPQSLARRGQYVSCDASSGTFTLIFNGAETDSINYDSDEAAVISALEELSTISEVNVTFADGVSQACQAYPDVLGFNVTFLEVPGFRGDVPLMTSVVDNLEVRLPTERHLLPNFPAKCARQLSFPRSVA